MILISQFDSEMGRKLEIILLSLFFFSSKQIWLLYVTELEDQFQVHS